VLNVFLQANWAVSNPSPYTIKAPRVVIRISEIKAVTHGGIVTIRNK
jgi:hypothetical protein